VPVGAFLSGGIDSSIVVGLMRRRGPVRTFTIGFEEAAFDERPAARASAEHFGTDHREYVVRASDAASLGTLMRRYGEPFADPSAVPAWVLAREARRHVTVALSGDGGDECFGGYRRYAAMRLLRAVRPAARAVAPFVRFGEKGRRLAGALREASAPPWRSYQELVTVGDVRALRGSERAVPDLIRDAWPEDPDPVNAAAVADLRTYLPDDLLVKTDIASMAHALEVRCPFLDPAVVGAALAIPGTRKVRGLRTKVALREAFRDLLPPGVRPLPKRGFGIPLDEWLRGALRGMLEDHLLDATARGRGLFDVKQVERCVRRQRAGAAEGRVLWALLAFETWMRSRPRARA
jgi:asparagine synthase (glutamine-hydrolysing)